MALSPQKLREIVFQLLFSLGFQKGDEETLIDLVMKEYKVTKKNARDALERAEKIHSHKEEIDERIKKVSTSYDISRIQAVEVNILRLAFYELFIEAQLPPNIVIAEAKRLSKKFATQEASAFVHGLIDGFLQKKET